MFHSVHGIGTKLVSKHVVYLKLASFTSNKGVFVNRLESVLLYFTEQNLMDRADPIELNFESLKLKQTKE